MWLLDTETGYFLNVHRPREYRYAILSHVWSTQGEQSFQDLRALQDEVGRSRPKIMQRVLNTKPRVKSVLSRASHKVTRCCDLAKRHGYRWVWIDSCCIDKTSSSELSEAINSMFEWYAAAEVCFAYLEDVGDDHDPRLKDSRFRRSRWFTRGWTLQELISPAVVVFVSKDWNVLGTKESLADVVEEVTGIDRDVLAHTTSLDSVSVARRMSWASKRQTTREEDRAYSLMGIFGVNMATIYGEGANAFVRLQEEIIKHVPDQSIFAWGPILYDDEVLYRNLGPYSTNDDSRYWQSRNLFAWSPDAFVSSANITSIPLQTLRDRLVSTPLTFSEYTASSFGLRCRFPLIPIDHGNDKMTYLGVLACEADKGGRLLALLLYPQHGGASSGLFYVGHYVGRPQVPPYAYFRAICLLPARSEELLRLAEVQDVCIPYRQPTMAQRRPRPTLSTTPFKCPCDVVVPGWILDKLRQKGFDVTLQSEAADQLMLHLKETTPPTTCVLVLRGAEETIRVMMGRCACLGSFLCATVVGDRAAGLRQAATASSKPTRSVNNASRSGLDEEQSPRCPTDHVATWQDGSKSFGYGLRIIRLTYSGWRTRQDVYLLEVEVGESEKEVVS